MAEYKVLVGKTRFPLKQAKGTEPKVVSSWDGVFSRIQNQRQGAESFVLHDGPPYANGDIHIGHALNKILKDITVRYQLMLGKNVHYQPGWDCHGLPIEWKVEEQYRAKKLNKDLDILAFRADCRQYAGEWLEKQKAQFRNLGVLADWDNTYSTMQFSSESKIVEKLYRFINKGLVYMGVKPTMWSPVEKTSLAEAEIEYQDVKTETLYVEFPFVSEDVSLIVWTTTPWTLPANRAIAYSSDIHYVQVNARKDQLVKKFVLAESLVEDFVKNTGWTCDVVGSFNVAGKWVSHPLYNTMRPLFPADFVKADTGTGFVHIAPGHGEDDFRLGKEHGLRTDSSIDDDGFMVEFPFKGLHVYKGNDAVREALGNAVVGVYSIVHSYPHSWRSKKPVIYKTTPQWFIRVDALREQALQSLENVEFTPSSGRNRITSMIRNRGDWCISRQRSWGVPLMMLVNSKGRIFYSEKFEQYVVNRVQEEGCDWWLNETTDDIVIKSKCEVSSDFRKVTDVLDVWFDSGSTFSFTLEDEHFPADLYLEGSDQHRGWFQSSLLVGVGTRGSAPYRGLLTHGFVLDGAGRKMSKSDGNVISPNDVVGRYSVDSLRAWVAQSDYTDDLRLSLSSSTFDTVGKIRNTLRFLVMNLPENQQVDRVAYSDLPLLEKLMLYKLYMLNVRLKEYLAKYEYHRIMAELYQFCANELSAFYFTIKKDSLYCDAEDSVKRRSCVTVLDILFDNLCSWLSPIIPFTIDEVWQVRHGGNSGDVFGLVLTELPDVWKDFDTRHWEYLSVVRTRVLAEIERLRIEKVVGSSLEVSISTNLLNIPIDDDVLLDYFGISEIVHSNTVELTVSKVSGHKCPRCWTYHQELIGELCHRCYNVVKAL